MKTSILALSALAASAFAAPARLVNRQNSNGISDLDVLQYALFLENLEISLYREGVSNLTDPDFTSAGYPSETRPRFLEIIAQEQSHIATLQSSIRMLGGTPISPCTYNFNLTGDAGNFLNTTDAVNGLGPSAYVGAGAFISNKTILTTGSAIGQIEARHNSWLSGVIGRDEFPATYQLPLTPTQAYSVAAPFVLSCPSSNPSLKAVQAYPPKLMVSNPAGVPGLPLNAGQTITLMPGANYSAPSSGTARVAFLYSLNTTIVDYDAQSMTATIPADCSGQSYAVLTTAQPGQALTVSNSLTGLAPFAVGFPVSRINQSLANLTVS